MNVYGKTILFRAITVIVSTIGGICCSTAFTGEPVQDEQAQGLLKGPATTGWQIYSAKSAQWSGSITDTTTITRKGGVPKATSYSISIKSTGSDTLITATCLDSEGSASRPYATVDGENDRYDFQLVERRKGEGWVLKSIIIVPAGGASANRVRGLADRERLDALRIGPKLLTEVIGYPYYKTLSVKEQGKLKRFDFDCQHDLDAKKPNSLQSGYFVLNPERDWTIEESSYAMKDSAGFISTIATNQYNGRGEPVQYDSNTNTALGIHMMRSTRYDLSSQFYPKGDFTLSAFGLPEPEGVVWDKPTPTYVWLLLAAGVLGLISFVFAWMKRRSTRTPSPAVSQ